jgi:hypothetical protein
MVDRTRLLEVVNGTDIAGIHPSLELLCDTARAVVEAPEIQWCKTHHAVRGHRQSDYIECRVVRVFLVPVEEES